MGACATEEKAKPTQRQLDADLERIQKSNRAKQACCQLRVIASGVNGKNKYGWTPLHEAAEYNRCEVAEVLLAAGADVNAKARNGSTPLHEAAEYNRCEVAEVLLAAGADVNAKNQDGHTPLDRARVGAMITLLKKAGVKKY